MPDMEIVKMSEKGQLVVPKDIRDMFGFHPSDRFIPFAVKDGVLFKKVEMPDIEAEFKSIAQEIRKQFSKDNITKADVEEAVQWSRK